MPALAETLITIAVLLLILSILERWIHRHLHGLSLLITGQRDGSLYLYALILLPGVLLHELSHWVTAKLLRVRTGRFSVVPRQQRDGSLTLGYVEYYRGPLLDPVRESLIGAAPLIWGIAAIGLIEHYVFSLPALQLSSDAATAVVTARQLGETPYILAWLYLLFVISNAMMPSSADRRAWPLFVVVLLSAFFTLYLLDARDLFAALQQMLLRLFSYVIIAFSITIVVDLLFITAIAILETIIGRLRGRRVDYRL